MIAFFFLLLLASAVDPIPLWENENPTYRERIEQGKSVKQSLGSCSRNESSCALSDLEQYEQVSIYTGGDTQCLDSNSPYRFLVYPGRSDRLVIYFQGGGACWNKSVSKWMVHPCRKTAAEPSSKSFGVFDRREPKNLYRDWTIIYILYCSGDLHVGNSEMTYTHGFSNKPIQHRGARNTLAVYNWIAEQNFQLDKFVIMGCSAGSIAAQLYAGSLLTMMQYKTGSVIMDSFVVMFSEDEFHQKWVQSHGFCHNDHIWSWSPMLEQLCGKGIMTFEDVLTATLRSFPKVTFAAVNSKQDYVQRMFYAITLSKYLSPTSYYQQLVALFTKYSEYHNFVSFLVDGMTHCFTNWHQLYHTTTMGIISSETDKTSLVSWIAALPREPSRIIRSHCHGETVSYLNVSTAECNARLKQVTVPPRLTYGWIGVGAPFLTVSNTNDRMSMESLESLGC